MADLGSEISGGKLRSVEPLRRVLSGWDTRLRLVQSLVWAPRGLAAGLALGLILAIAARAWPLLTRDNLLWLIVVLALIGLVAALAGVWLWGRSTLEMARRFDRAFNLKERMATSVELATGRLPVQSEQLADRQYHQTLRVSSRVRPAEGLPLRADWREWAALAIPIAAIAASVLLPNPQEVVLEERQAVQEAIEQQLQELRDLREEVLANEELSAEEQAQIVEALDEAIRTLEQPEITQEEAVAALQAAEQTLRDLSEQAAAEQQEALQRASEALDGTAAQAAADALEEDNLAGAQEALENLDVDSLTPEEQEELADALEEAAEALEGTNPEAAESMREAAEALRSGDTAAAEGALSEAAEALGEGTEAAQQGQAGDGQAAVQQIEGYADQLERGQDAVGSAGSGDRQGGQGGMAQVQPGSGGQGSSSQQGQQGQGGGAGRGEGSGEGQGRPESQMGNDNDPGDGGETDYDEIYDPQRIGGEGGPQVDVPGDPGAGVPTGAEGDFVENPDGDATVPYNEVYGDYEGAVNEALDSGYVPLGLRDVIQGYFTRLDPSNPD